MESPNKPAGRTRTRHYGERAEKERLLLPTPLRRTAYLMVGKEDVVLLLR